ncbi:MAG: sigma-70 family RNA polymerase sigma factor [Hyphomicrobiaceae bacterium]|nr:sigma-70 family RNA polymerase sigma factor [Hyphomicrobiaceae bacterium]
MATSSPSRQTSQLDELIARVANGRDREAFAELFRSYAPRLKSYMMRQGTDSGTAEELVQETLLAVWRKAALYSGEKGSPTTWIFTIARNLRIDRLRREVPWQALPEGHDETPSDDTAPDEALSLDERQTRVRSAMADLPPEQLEIVRLAFVDGLSQSEIADRLRIPLGTVKSRMRLAYHKMRGTVEDLNDR